MAHTVLHLAIELKLPAVTAGLAVVSMVHGLDRLSCIGWSIVVDTVVRFGEVGFVTGTYKNLASTLMMSCSIWSERKPECVFEF